MAWLNQGWRRDIQYSAWAGVAGDGEAAAHSTIEEGEREIAIRYDTMFLN